MRVLADVMHNSETQCQHEFDYYISDITFIGYIVLNILISEKSYYLRHDNDFKHVTQSQLYNMYIELYL